MSITLLALSSLSSLSSLSYLQQLRENPEQYCEELLHNLKIADKRTYFAALPADIEHLARRYSKRLCLHHVGRHPLCADRGSP